ncbi:hypothetical protein ACQQ9V_03375 [Hornefia butyriciproducens]|uniref:hypothetical protein n=1 Tax=Hornefia butyriciproducens TaxID=2652293 RepID=UPI003D023F95
MANIIISALIELIGQMTDDEVIFVDSTLHVIYNLVCIGLFIFKGFEEEYNKS